MINKPTQTLQIEILRWWERDLKVVVTHNHGAPEEDTFEGEDLDGLVYTVRELCEINGNLKPAQATPPQLYVWQCADFDRLSKRWYNERAQLTNTNNHGDTQTNTP
jgi:hypothetical protein